MKYLLIIGDGMADNPVPSLGGKTPLEHAAKPFIDSLARRGEVGSVLTVPEGLPAGSDTAILSIFGNDPTVCFTGRSPLEAAGAGVQLKAGDISYRLNMVSLDLADRYADSVILSHNAGSIDGETSMALIRWLCEQPEFAACLAKLDIVIHPTPSFRHIAVQGKGGIDGLVATPPHDILKSAIGPYLPKGCPEAEILNEAQEIASRLLPSHPLNRARIEAGKLPANGIWFWAEGSAVLLDDFTEKYGVSGAVISAVPLVFGIAALGKPDTIEVEGATGELDTNYEGKVEAAIRAFDRYDFVGVHIEAPDECTHNGDLEGKIRAIEYLDGRVTKPIVEALERRGEPFRLLMLSDHKTLTSTRTHDGDPVPYLIYDSRNTDGCGRDYTEKSGESGAFIKPGYGLIAKLFEK